MRQIISASAKLAGVAALAIGLSVPSASSAVNVVVNGTFDDTADWNLLNGTFVVLNGPGGGFPTLDTGPYYQGGNAGFSEIAQDFSLSAQQVSDLGTFGLEFVMSADLFGFSSQQDSSEFTAEFLDINLNVIDTATLDSDDGDPGIWPSSLTAGAEPNFQSVSGVLPIGTRHITFFVSSERFEGSSNDGYLDNAVFDITVSTTLSPVPVPAALPLMAAAVGAFTLMGWRRRNLA